MKFTCSIFLLLISVHVQFVVPFCPRLCFCATVNFSLSMFNWKFAIHTMSFRPISLQQHTDSKGLDECNAYLSYLPCFPSQSFILFLLRLQKASNHTYCSVHSLAKEKVSVTISELLRTQCHQQIFNHHIKTTTLQSKTSSQLKYYIGTHQHISSTRLHANHKVATFLFLYTLIQQKDVTCFHNASHAAPKTPHFRGILKYIVPG